MSKIDELIKEKCPDGVEYSTIGEICSIEKGTQLNKDSLLEDGKYPVINGGISPSGYWDDYNFEANKITISQGGASAGYVNFIKTPFWAGAHCYVINSCKDYIDYDYLWHFLRNKQQDMMSKQIGAGIPSVSLKMINDFKMPVPPIEIQREISRMLNSFTELEAELEAELTKRKQQYEHYRDHLLSFENLAGEGGQVEWLPLEDVAKIKNGSGYKDFGAGPYPVYGTGGIMTRVDRFAYDRPSVLIPRKGSLDRVYYVEEPFWNVDTIFYTEIDEQKIVPKYFYYFLSSKHLEELNQAAGIPSLTQTTLNKIKVPVPPLKIQEHMVYVLDNFDAVCNDLNIGLPAEIEARQKQYEYYRDKLLNFDAVVGSGTERERERGVAKLRQYIFGYAQVRLSTVAGYSKSRISSSELNENTFVGVDNLLQNKLGKTTSEHIPESGNWAKYSPEDVLIGNIRPYLRKIWFADNTGGASGDVLVVRNDFEQLDSRYLYHVLSSEKFFEYNDGKSKGSKMPRGDKTAIMEYAFVIPAPEKQKEIASTLDEFDKLTNDIASGLPAEIEARHKQYEYYRDKLLSFDF